jgi:hypothetical protein
MALENLSTGISRYMACFLEELLTLSTQRDNEVEDE